MERLKGTEKSKSLLQKRHRLCETDCWQNNPYRSLSFKLGIEF